MGGRAGLVVLLLAASARAAIDDEPVRDEREVDALEARGDLTADHANGLRSLLREGVDLATASRSELLGLPGVGAARADRILALRASHGPVDLASLTAAGVLDEALARRLEPFVRTLPQGWQVTVRALSEFTVSDDLAPPALLSARAVLPWGLLAGVELVGTRLRPRAPRFEVPAGTLATAGFEYQVNLARGFVQWRAGPVRLVAGTFSLGFAEHLVLDTTRAVAPDGLLLTDDFRRGVALTRRCKLVGATSGPCVDQPEHFVTPDLAWHEPFRGLAASLEHLALGPLALSATAFGSWQTRSIYQYELYDRRRCADPHADAERACAPPVVLTPEGLRVVDATLPAMFDELALGGHVGAAVGRVSFGVTGYGASPTFRTGAGQLDFQEWSRWPNGGPFGALGADVSVTGLHGVDLFLEAARSVDHAVGNGGGGYALEQRTTWSNDAHLVELSLRFYDLHFANPYARPISSPDEYDGQRARNEAGVWVRSSSRLPGRWHVSSRVDFWVTPFDEPSGPRAGVANVYALVRVDAGQWARVRPSAWVDVRVRDLAGAVGGGCSAVAPLTQATCPGDLYRLAARSEFEVHPRWAQVVVEGWLSLVSEPGAGSRLRTDGMVWVDVRSAPLESVLVRARTRWLDEDLGDAAASAASVWSSLEATWQAARWLRLTARTDVVAWVDRRPSTLVRRPNPELRFLLDVTTTF